ncbi:nuclear transport factor 2 family protein [Mucilaginibacter sp. BJC16-A38]|uniref:nuclear transport factor 2 family protein n=1 Tax=Mucilaginibacter phenanthrenivorans TaxID=1234842 RepID=UPI00215843C3|nr:nuclear transport factor 2 family protein [Mucilaginibacter phenanthrenivorans]MCR8559025.1 nuclear transport factor 2 family protein [Mucilaginibacter phenanthrenivorans]
METAGKTVQSFLKALNDEDFKAARGYLTDDVKFVGVMGTRDGGDTYIADMEKMKFKYSIQKVFADGGDVSVFYDINMGGTTVFCSGWYQLQNGRINSIKVIFDPRPLLEKK